ncbi:leucine carboxyl methyltransferase 1 [Bimuria novae-zelandiae CBS 107.79]|uniref:Leucine carboxyl methyltransferase 1 n=1 Tax=Bimuria novae-zelandiae CBS 107.79 TaxID=1447943 RepID=A0A6A5VTI0_9PLEO|nr:leucine carboxyl methyltransferase 1 [Bimuria novae-zelandiae CBS 107.79]
MDNNQIPNLKTLLGRGRGGGLRGRARGGYGSSTQGDEAVRDNAVRGTDQDAAGSRVSCVEFGYLDDPYAKFFATQSSTRRLPLLNRGTYVRTSAIDQLVDHFLTTPTSTQKQIISLGAGTDTRYFRLRDKYPNEPLVYHEIDFATNTTAKLQSIRRHPSLQDRIGDSHFALKPTADSYHSASYNIHALDLRSLTTSSPPPLENLSPTLPTLILSEMCLIYLHPTTVSGILNRLLTHYVSPRTPASLVLYEPIFPHDAFGRTMISNLSTRNIHLPTLTAYPGLVDQRARLRQYGFGDGCRAADTKFIWRVWVSEEEKERVAGLEMLDELEELELLLRHYCVAWGWRDGEGEGEDVFSRAWSEVREQDGG